CYASLEVVTNTDLVTRAEILQVPQHPLGTAIVTNVLSRDVERLGGYRKVVVEEVREAGIELLVRVDEHGVIGVTLVGLVQVAVSPVPRNARLYILVLEHPDQVGGIAEAKQSELLVGRIRQHVEPDVA